MSADGGTPGGALGQILVGDVPSKFQKHTRSLYQFFEKSIPDLIPIFRKSISFLIFIPKPEGCITPRKGVRDFFGSKNPSNLGPDLRIFPNF